MEALGAANFGPDELGAVCKHLVGRGHDVQLHLHPTQRRPFWRTNGEPNLPDDMHAYPVEEQAALLRQGKEALEKAGSNPIVGFRAGNFGANDLTWQAMAKAGFAVSSNYNPSYMHRCTMSPSSPSAGLFPSPVPGVWELPMSCFVEASGGKRHVQISAVSTAETIECLKRSRDMGVGEVTILTHSFELFHVDSIEKRTGRPNRVNAMRLRKLCEFLASSKDFQVDTVGALAARLPAEAPAPKPLPRGRRRYKLLRLAEQAYKRLEAKLHFS
jgi:hypothetical protein